jgi:hypothetical protein
MIAQRFPESNITFTKPEGWTERECADIAGFIGTYGGDKGKPVVLTAWKPTPEELVKLNLGEPLWLHLAYDRMVPVLLTTDHPWETKSEENKK